MGEGICFRLFLTLARFAGEGKVRVPFPPGQPIFKGDILILLCSNIGATHVPEQIAFSALSVLLKPSSDQRSNNGTKSIPGSLWFDLDLQTALSGVHEYGGLCHRSFVNGNRHPLLLREGADSANMIAGQSFSIGSHHHLCRLAVKCAGQLFHADFTIRWDDNTTGLPSTSAISVFRTRRGSAPMA